MKDEKKMSPYCNLYSDESESFVLNSSIYILDLEDYRTL